MNADRLMAHFERISDAPDAVSKLRRFILDLAVRGKLVDQDSGEGTAERLLGSRAVAAEPGQAPFPLPPGWAWTTLARIGDSCGGGTPSKADPAYWQGDIPWVTPKDMKVSEINDAQDHISEAGVANSSARLIPAGAVLMVVRGMILAHSFPAAINRRSVTINQDMKAVVPFLPEMSQMLLLLMQGMKPQILALVKHSTHGTCKLLTDELFALLLPLPPLAEQHRIIAKVDELMMLCDRLEASQAERDSRRDRLVVASLNRLSQPTDSDEFKKDAGFTLSHLNRLSTKPQHIKELRKAILNLAVRGRLVPQDEREGNASDLLAQHGVAVEASDEVRPFSVPDSWAWLPVGRVCSKTGSGSTPRGGKSAYVSKGIPFLRSQNVHDDGLHLDDVAYIDTDTYRKMIGTAVQSDDLLLNITGGSMGRCCHVPSSFTEGNVSQHVAILRVAIPGTQAFLHKCIISPFFQTLIFDEQTGAGRGGLPKNRMDRLPIPLPPLAEQKRIVAKVDELMAICDQLETQLESQQKGRRQLLEALLHEALKGVG